MRNCSPRAGAGTGPRHRPDYFLLGFVGAHGPVPLLALGLKKVLPPRPERR